MRHLTAMLTAALLGACADFPDIDAAVSGEAEAEDYPELVPAERIANRGIPPDWRPRAPDGG